MHTSIESEDSFFDANDDFRNSIGSSSPVDSFVDYQDSVLQKLEYEFWTKELMSIQERRNRFLREMGFQELAESSLDCFTSNEDSIVDLSEKHVESETVTNNNSILLNASSSCYAGDVGKSLRCIRDLDTGKEFIVYNMGLNGGSSVFKEIGSEKLMTLQEFEMSLGLSHSVQKHLRKDKLIEGNHNNFGLGEKKKPSLGWWRSFVKRNITARPFKCDISVNSSKVPKLLRIKVRQYRKRRKELTTVYMGQEIQAHRGSVRTMKFSPCGRYLATGGEDCVVRIWQIKEVESYCRCLTMDGLSKIPDKVKDLKLILGKGNYSAPVVIPKKVFKIDDTPLQELLGHSSDILDLSWSQSDCLLTSSKDKTVRMWKVGCFDCLKIFEHNDYVTCVQFNPVDDAYFISGSIDGKARIWGTTENRVVDWVDIRDIITAICHRPDGKGFVVGSISGDCRFYDYSDSAASIQLNMQLSIKGKRKSAAKPITALQFFPKDTKQIMITSADSRVRIFDGVDAVHKFKGLRRAKSQFSAAFTSDESHFISVGKDSHVYIWSPCKASKGAKSIRSFEYFFSKGALLAAAWPGMDLEKTRSSDRSSEPESFSHGAWLFSDGSSRVSATWPEEELPSPTEHSLGTNNSYQVRCCHHVHYSNLASIAALWNLVIVTASNDGTIRSFHNYGLPVRL